MPLLDPNLEPAIRDPRKLRNTALVLVAIMLVGGGFITLAYNRWTREQNKNDRPAATYRITPERDLPMLRQDGKTADLIGDGKRVLAVNVLSPRDPAAAERSMAVMQRLATSRAGNPDFQLVTLVLDPQPAEKLLPSLRAVAEQYGAELPQWAIGSNEPATLLKFIYNQLKATTYPTDKDGKWDYDGSIVLIDRNANIRRAVVPQQRGGPSYVATFDFDQAAAWDARHLLTNTDKSNVEELELLLGRTIDKLLVEKPEPPPSGFTRYLLPALAILLLGGTVLIIVSRHRRRQRNTL